MHASTRSAASRRSAPHRQPAPIQLQATSLGYVGSRGTHSDARSPSNRDSGGHIAAGRPSSAHARSQSDAVRGNAPEYGSRRAVGGLRLTRRPASARPHLGSSRSAERRRSSGMSVQSNAAVVGGDVVLRAGLRGRAEPQRRSHSARQPMPRPRSAVEDLYATSPMSKVGRPPTYGALSTGDLSVQPARSKRHDGLSSTVGHASTPDRNARVLVGSVPAPPARRGRAAAAAERSQHAPAATALSRRAAAEPGAADSVPREYLVDALAPQPARVPPWERSPAMDHGAVGLSYKVLVSAAPPSARDKRSQALWQSRYKISRTIAPADAQQTTQASVMLGPEGGVGGAAAHDARAGADAGAPPPHGGPEVDSADDFIFEDESTGEDDPILRSLDRGGRSPAARRTWGDKVVAQYAAAPSTIDVDQPPRQPVPAVVSTTATPKGQSTTTQTGAHRAERNARGGVIGDGDDTAVDEEHQQRTQLRVEAYYSREGSVAARETLNFRSHEATLTVQDDSMAEPRGLYTTSAEPASEAVWRPASVDDDHAGDRTAEPAAVHKEKYYGRVHDDDGGYRAKASRSAAVSNGSASSAAALLLSEREAEALNEEYRLGSGRGSESAAVSPTSREVNVHAALDRVGSEADGVDVWSVPSHSPRDADDHRGSARKRQSPTRARRRGRSPGRQKQTRFTLGVRINGAVVDSTGTGVTATTRERSGRPMSAPHNRPDASAGSAQRRRPTRPQSAEAERRDALLQSRTSVRIPKDQQPQQRQRRLPFERRDRVRETGGSGAPMRHARRPSARRFDMQVESEVARAGARGAGEAASHDTQEGVPAGTAAPYAAHLDTVPGRGHAPSAATFLPMHERRAMREEITRLRRLALRGARWGKPYAAPSEEMRVLGSTPAPDGASSAVAVYGAHSLRRSGSGSAHAGSAHARSKPSAAKVEQAAVKVENHREQMQATRAELADTRDLLSTAWVGYMLDEHTRMDKEVERLRRAPAQGTGAPAAAGVADPAASAANRSRSGSAEDATGAGAEPSE